MKTLTVLGLAGWLLLALTCSRVYASQVWSVTSPDHEQTFAYGTETRRQWSARGNHLVLFIDFTNDPFVDRSNPRQYDSFSFDFPQVKLQPDGRTFSYRAPGGHLVPVALRHPGFLGIEEIELLPTSELIVFVPHGRLTLTLREMD
jgi:hypothetical protein